MVTFKDGQRTYVKAMFVDESANEETNSRTSSLKHFINYMAFNGARVTNYVGPGFIIQNGLLVEVFEEAKETEEDEEWYKDFWSNFGKSVAAIHKLSKQYKKEHP
jgi:uncharacterized protein YozE (UPF0346 family)